MPPQPEYPEGGGEQALQVAIAHLQVLLAAIASFDGKSMFLTSVSVVALSAQGGIIAAYARDATLAIAIVGLVVSSLAVLSGLWNLWGAETSQFPAPSSLISFRAPRPARSDKLAWAYLAAIMVSSVEAEDVLVRKVKRFRLLLVLTTASLAFGIASAIPSAF